MSDRLERGLEFVKRAEKDLRALLSEAAEAGDYESAARIANWAGRLRTLVDAVRQIPGPAKPNPGGRRRQPIPRTYPRFYKADGKLAMVAWSKKNQAEYEHKAPREVLDQLVELLMQGAEGTDPMGTEALLDGLKSVTGERLPYYYGRTFLRWLRTLGLVEKHGHSGYSVRNHESFPLDVKQHWRQLPIGN